MFFPKGGWETDESIEEAAARETFEEAGVCGTIEFKLENWMFKSKRYGTYYEGFMFSLFVKEQPEFWAEKDVRTRRWMSVEEAKDDSQIGFCATKSMGSFALYIVENEEDYRSYLYILFHELVALPSSWLFGDEKVPQCIDKLAQAGLKIWVLTGDKMETAINIGFACSLLQHGMKRICITTMDTDLNAENAEQMAREHIFTQITDGAEMIKQDKDPHAAFALIIDGKTLTYALKDDLKHQFLKLAIACASVICCRVSPKQKALVTKLVKEGSGKTTLAIGDGANNVGMIQEADIGIGISGVEGMQHRTERGDHSRKTSGISTAYWNQYSHVLQSYYSADGWI